MPKHKTIDEIHDIVLAVNQAILRDGQSVEKACKGVGVEVANYYRWRNKAAQASASAATNKSKAPRRHNMRMTPMDGEFEIETISKEEAGALLAQVVRMGIYSRFVPKVIETCAKLPKDQHIRFHVPEYAGKDPHKVGLGMMTSMNYALKRAGIMHKIRFIDSEKVCVSEPYTW